MWSDEWRKEQSKEGRMPDRVLAKGLDFRVYEFIYLTKQNGNHWTPWSS